MVSRARFWVGFLVIVLGAVAFFMFSGLTWTDVQHAGTPRNAIEIHGQSVRIPLPEESDGRIYPEVEPTTTGSHVFTFYADDEPVRFDPCRVIPLVINPTGGPPNGDELILGAVGQVSEATGLAFDYEGHTTERADFDRALIQTDRYGERLVPVIVGWSNEEFTPELAGSVTGLGGSTSVTGAYGDDRFLTSGVVILDSPDLTALLATGNGRRIVFAVIMHEVAHVVGLGHVDDATELMNATNTYLTDWGPGDREGLAIAGAGPCQDV